MTMADTVAVMNQGRIEQMGSPEELYDLPRTTFVANFLGRSNLISGTVLPSSGDTVRVGVEGGEVALPRNRAVVESGQVWVGIRPEKVRLSEASGRRDDGADEQGGNALLGGVVRDVCFVGVSTEYVVEMPWGQEITVFEQNHTSQRRYHGGDKVDLAWAPQHTFLLDAAQDAQAGIETVDQGAG